MDTPTEIKMLQKKPADALFLLSSILAILASIFFVLRGSVPNPASWLDLSWIYFLFILSAFIFLSSFFFVLKNPTNFLEVAKKILLIFGPAEIILVIGFQIYNRLSFFPFSLPLLLAIGIYILIAGIYLIFKLQRYQTAGDFWRDFKTIKEKSKEKKWIAGIMLAAIIILNLSFGSYHLAEFAAVDEPLWTFNRIPKFWNNVKEREFYKTMVSDKPGITVAILSGIGLNWTNTKEFQLTDGQDKENFTIPGIKKMNFAMRFPILLFNAILLIPLYFFIKRLSKKFTAAISLVLIGLSPILLGMSTIINPDSLLWSISTLCFLGFLIYLKNQEKRYLYYSGFFLGLAILTKYIANIFYVFFFGLIFLEFVLNHKKYENISISEYFKRAFTDYLTLVIISLLTFFIFLPAAWVNVMRVAEATILSKAFIKFWPAFIFLILLVFLDTRLNRSRILSLILGKLAKYKNWIKGGIIGIFILSIIAVVFDTYSGMRPYDFESILASPKSSYLNGSFFSLFLANFYSLIFGLIPLALLSILFWPAKIIRKNDGSAWPVYIILFIIVYYLASTVENVSATVRYQIIVYPLALILSAAGISELDRVKIIKKYLPVPVFYLVIFIASIYSLNFIRPFYMSYASDLLPQNYVLNLKDMGDGSYEAAQYLNKLPNAKNLVVWTDKRGVCYFFVGGCETGFDFDKAGTIFDYYVVTSGRESRTTKMTVARVQGGNTTLFRLDKLYDIENPEYKLEIGDRPNSFVKVIDSQDL